MTPNQGFSLTEVMIGVFLLALLLLPLMTVMSQSAGQTVVSFHEQLAVHLVRELLDQVAELARNDTGPRLAGLVQAGGKPLADLLQDLNPALSDGAPTGLRVLTLGRSQIGLVVSPLVTPFRERFFQVREVDASTFGSKLPMRVFQVTAGVRWKSEGDRPGHSLRTFEASVFVMGAR